MMLQSSILPLWKMTQFPSLRFFKTKIFHVTVLIITIFIFHLPPTSNHPHPQQVENCDSNSRLVVDEDDNSKFRHDKVVYQWWLFCTTQGQLILKMGNLDLAAFCVKHAAELNAGLGQSPTQQAIVQTFLKNYDKVMPLILYTIFILVHTFYIIYNFGYFFNPYNAELFLFKPCRLKVIFQFKIIINVLDS